MNARRPTGIPNLDSLIQGGLKEKSITLVEGDAGSGKSTLSVSYVVAGINAGENGIYISVEESRENFFENMGYYGFDLAKYEKEGSLFFYECNPQKLKESLDKGTIGIEDKITEIHAKRLVLDSISAFVTLYETEAKQRAAVHRLFEKLRSWGLTTLVIAEAAHTQHNNNWASYLVDGWIRLYYKKSGRERIRTIEVLKMRGTKHDATEVVYRIEDKGINLYPNERVFGTD
ncbi:MAG: ATPase domain-containing protein [Candidatus Altiarchaeota archaeon]